jgi:hypothetical protein
VYVPTVVPESLIPIGSACDEPEMGKENPDNVAAISIKPDEPS